MMIMNGEQRRNAILNKLNNSSAPMSGSRLAQEFHVSRQVIVQDIALLRAEGHEILSASRGYQLTKGGMASRVFKVFHTSERTEEEMNVFVDYGGFIKDIFIYHRAYGVVSVPLEIRSRLEVRRFIDEKMSGGISKGLSDATSGYHYHTIEAESEEILDLIQDELGKRGFLAQLTDYEPVDFRNQRQECLESSC